MTKRTRSWIWTIVTLCTAVAFAGCGGDEKDDDGDGTMDSGMPDVAMDMGVDAAPDMGVDAAPDMGIDAAPDAMPDTMPDMGTDAGADADATGGATEFEVTIENVSAESGTPTPYAPGAWAVHTTSDPFFTTGMADRGEGLEGLAEDGGGATLAGNLQGEAGITSAGSFGSGPLAPGGSTSFTVEASPGDGGLSLATMFVQSNDVFVAPEGGSIALFDGGGQPMSQRDVTDKLALFDAGTERDQAPWFGPNQAPRQSGKDTGPSEGVVAPFDDATRALPLASGIVDVTVSESNGTFTVGIENVSESMGAVVTPLAPVFWAVHDSSFSYFTPGMSADSALETQAEDGSPADLVAAHSGASGVKQVGAQAQHKSGGAMGPAPPGETFEFSVEPNASHPMLSFSAMVVESNDVFVALRGGGVHLMDGSGNPRSGGEVEAEIERRLALWDAGTEANEVPGVGANQPLRQSGADTGPDDPNDSIRLYTDSTNDLDGDQAGGFLDVTITHGANAMEFDVTVTNDSSSTVYPGVATPLAWAVHDSSVSLFQTGQPASGELEQLAEDGAAMPLANSLTGSGVKNAGVQSDKGGSTGPLMPGESYSFTITADQSHPFFNFASMVVPSNDTFTSFGPGGIRLVDQSGNRRSEGDIATDVASMLRAWDAGTEANQAGAAGPDQAPRQSGPDTGPSEGDGTVQKLTDEVWAFPKLTDVVEVTVAPK